MRECLAALLLALLPWGGTARATPPPPPLPPAAAEAPPADETVDKAPEADETPDAEETGAGAATAAPAVEEAHGESAPSGYQAMTGHVETLTDGDLRVSVLSGEMRPARGYLPVQVILYNQGSAPRAVRLDVEPGRGGRGGSVSRQVEVAAHQRLVAWLPVPVLEGGAVRVSGPGLSLRPFSLYSVEPSGQPVLVLGSEQAFVSGTRMARADQRPQVSARFVPLEDAPRELAAYVGASPVVVAGDVTALSAEAWSALEAYAATGGQLVLLKPPRDVARRLPLLEEPSKGLVPYGLGQVRLCEAESCGSALLADLGPPTAGERAHAGILSPAGEAPRWRGRGGQLNGGVRPLLPGVQAPVGRFMLLITLFVLAVGPGGLVLARRKGAVALLVAVPSVALLTCLGIVLWAVLVEGFSLHAARYSLLWLDRERARVLVAGVGGYYANLEPRPFQVPLLGALLSPDLDWDSQAIEADWTQGMKVTGGFLPSRTYREWGELAAVPSRIRLVVRREGEGYRVRNALGAHLMGGCVRLGGQLWSLSAIAPDAEGVLAPVEKDFSEASFVDSSFLARDRFTAEAWTALQRPLPEGAFLARLDGGGMGPTTALEVVLEGGEHFMRGRVDGP